MNDSRDIGDVYLLVDDTDTGATTGIEFAPLRLFKHALKK